ncbi:hypothetical protein PAMP_013926 [Pampus punctatissimus]
MSSMESQRYARRLPVEPLHGHDVQTALRFNTVQQKRSSTSCRMFNVDCKLRLNPITWMDVARMTEVTTLFPSANKTITTHTHRRKSHQIRAFLLSSHNKSTHFQKLCKTAGVRAATPAGISEISPSLNRSLAQLKLHVSEKTKYSVRIQRLFTCAPTP